MSADCGRFGRPLNDDRFIVVVTFAEPGRWLNGYRTAVGVGRLSRVARFIYLDQNTNIIFFVYLLYMRTLHFGMTF